MRKYLKNNFFLVFVVVTLTVLIIVSIYNIMGFYKNYETKCDSKKNLKIILKQYVKNGNPIIDPDEAKRIFLSKFSEEEQKTIYIRALGASLYDLNNSDRLSDIRWIYSEFSYNKKIPKSRTFMSIYDYKNQKTYDILKRDIILESKKEYIPDIVFAYIELKYKCILNK